MSNQYCVFLRGVNVNGIKIKMADLRLLLSDAGYKDVATVLASGNVILTDTNPLSTTQSLRSQIEALLTKTYNYDAHVIVHTANEIKDISEEAKTYNTPEDYHHYLLLTNDPSLPQDLTTLFESLQTLEGEALVNGSYGTYWIVPKSSTLSSKFGSLILSRKTYKARLTSRTINTIYKVVNKLD